MKTGDTVLHRPSGETWTVAYVNEDSNDLAWCGWPSGLARMSDCDLIESCTTEESAQLIHEIATISGSDHRKSWAILAVNAAP